MQGFQCQWSAPVLAKKGLATERIHSDSFAKGEAIKLLALPDYQLLSTILSALKWRQINGPLRLYTDAAFYQCLEEWGLLDLWDDVDVSSLKQIDCKAYNPAVFWNVGKTVACLTERAPCVFLDNDLIVWHDIQPYCNVPIRVAHLECAAESKWYPSMDSLRTASGYQPGRFWCESTNHAANVALVFFGDQDFKNYYTNESSRYMDNNISGEKPETTLGEFLFSDQRLLALCAKEKGISLETFIDLEWKPVKGEWIQNGQSIYWSFCTLDRTRLFSHIWFYKDHLKVDKLAYTDYCQSLADCIVAEFPQSSAMLRKIPTLQHYFR